MESRKPNWQKQSGMVVTRGGGLGEWERCCLRYILAARRKPWRSNAHHSDYRKQNYILHIKLSERIDLNYFHHKKL